MVSKKSKPLVGWVVGSASDLPVMDKGLAILDKLQIPHELIVASAHRTPSKVDKLARDAKKRGWKIIVAAAGMANHLAGAFAARTQLPVIGLPVASGSLAGLDSLLSTVQMPPGVPVATVSIGSAGGVNAAVLAARILSLNDKALLARLDKYVAGLGAAVKKS